MRIRSSGVDKQNIDVLSGAGDWQPTSMDFDA